MIGMSGSQWAVLVPGDLTEGRFAIVDVRAQRGSEPPRHVHSREDEVIYVLEGRVTFDRGGQRLDGPAGTWMFLPRGCEHTYTVESAAVRLLVILSPAGLERCLGEPDRRASPVADQLAVERLVATAARYGVAITGPGWPPWPP